MTKVQKEKLSSPNDFQNITKVSEEKTRKVQNSIQKNRKLIKVVRWRGFWEKA